MDKIQGVTSGVGPSSKVSQISLSSVSFLQTNEGKSACINFGVVTNKFIIERLNIHP